ncbi:MAG: hypothetical protein GOMPHAMPRED_002126 [Gomphillus americanus]|uniref:Transcriptional regulator n=1 Tax=Gomphillus americanus TaxID=1940652 RepID=A0A8H3FDM9_9LECA|nr:MAG: hypothetical protein GOMPHAMPRED_002126 [Gomphillus americanus]
MYIRDIHADGTISMLRQLILNNPLGILTTGIRSTVYPFLQSSHIPFVLDVVDPSSETELGTLRGHLARSNPQSKAIIEALRTNQASSSANILEEEVLVLFTCSAHHYVTPKFYTETKPKSGKVVPTWNYAAAQAYGKAKIHWDHKSAESCEFLMKQMHDLSEHAESSIMGYTGQGNASKPWSIHDAPEKYIELLRTNIIGIEIKIDRLEGKFKMSQEMPLGDRHGVVDGLADLGSEIGMKVSEIVRERSANKETKQQAIKKRQE